MLCVLDSLLIGPTLRTPSLSIGGSFGAFLLLLLSVSGMYNICRLGVHEKKGALSVMIAMAECFFFISRDCLSQICYPELFPQSADVREQQMSYFGVHAMITVLLSCCLGRVVWQYRSDILDQIHSSKWNALCNYLTFGW